MNPDTAALLTDKMFITGAILLGGIILCVFVTIWIVIDSRHKAAEARDREESRREIAAYVAEGTISPQDAALIIASGPDDYRKRIADAVARGSVRAADAAAILNSPATPVRA